MLIVIESGLERFPRKIILIKTKSINIMVASVSMYSECEIFNFTNQN